MKMKLGFVQDNPTPRTPSPTMKWGIQFAGQTRSSLGVHRSWPRTRYKLSIQNLAHPMRRYSSEVVVGCAPAGWFGHGLQSSSTRPEPPGLLLLGPPAAAQTLRKSRYTARVAPPRNYTWTTPSRL